MKNYSILLVEDELAILNNLGTILEISGYKCYKANSAFEALEHLENITPQLILCDVMMPEMDGFELLQKIRQNPKTASIPFCFLSARADILDIDYGLSLGANGYITKPFTAKDLIQTVQKLLPKDE
ncbi:MAG: response regulator [Chitinophagaceae bacterium]|nr:response regulator [Chitinophagaceae bacterium]